MSFAGSGLPPIISLLLEDKKVYCAEMPEMAEKILEELS